MSELPLDLNTIVITPWVGCQKAVRVSLVAHSPPLGLPLTGALIKPDNAMTLFYNNTLTE